MYEAQRPGETLDTIDAISDAVARLDAIPGHAWEPANCAPIRYEVACRIFEIRTGHAHNDLLVASEMFPDLAPGFSGLPFSTTYGEVP